MRSDLPLLLAAGLLLLGGSVRAAQTGMSGGTVALLVLGATVLGAWIYSQGDKEN